MRPILIIAGAGVLFCWAFVFLISPAIRLGLSDHAANLIPFAGLAIGLSVGFGAQRYQSLRHALGYAFLPLILGGAFWFLGLAIGALMLLVGIPVGVDYVPAVAFGAGMVLGAVPLYAVLADFRRGPGDR